jgi:hypothetical protein
MADIVMAQGTRTILLWSNSSSCAVVSILILVTTPTKTPHVCPGRLTSLSRENTGRPRVQPCIRRRRYDNGLISARLAAVMQSEEETPSNIKQQVIWEFLFGALSADISRMDFFVQSGRRPTFHNHGTEACHEGSQNELHS